MAENSSIVPEGKVKFTQVNFEADFEKAAKHKSKLALHKIKSKDFFSMTMEAYEKHGAKMYEMLGFEQPTPF